MSDLSNAWEVTMDDVSLVLNAHGCLDGLYSDIGNITDKLDHDEVVKAVLHYTDFEEQCDAALREIEKQLKEAGHIPKDAETQYPIETDA